MITKERPMCRQAIIDFGLRPSNVHGIAFGADGTRQFLSVGMRMQMKKMRAEGYWPRDQIVRLDHFGRRR